MRVFLACLSLTALSLTSLKAQTNAPALPSDAARLSGAYRAELAKAAEAYNASLLPLAENYVLALKKLSVRMKEAKDAAGSESVRKEAARFMKALGAEPDPFEAVPELTKDATAATEAIRLVQEDYVARRTLNDQTRNDKAHELAEKYCSGLDLLFNRYSADAQAQDAAAVKKEATRIRVALQRKDFANRAFAEAGASCRLMPPVPDVAALKEKAESAPSGTRNLSALALTDLSPVLQAFLVKPLEYDKKWPPEITQWKFEGTGNYSHDFSLYNQAGLPDEFGIFAYAKTLRAYVRGTKKASTVNFNNQAITWLGKAMAWRLNDSRDLVCKVVFTTKRPALKEDAGPAACVAVYSVSENNRLIASMSVPMLEESTQVRMAKHYSYNRLNIFWEGTQRKRGFTIPDHVPLRVVVGIVGFAPGEEADATIEILPCGQLGDS
jgi:hypothetical protein